MTTARDTHTPPADERSLWTSQAAADAELPVGIEAVDKTVSLRDLHDAVDAAKERVADFSGRLSEAVLKATF